MTLQEFCEYTVTGAMTDEGIQNRWNRFCEELKNMDVYQIKDMIEDGFLDSLLEFENEDGFGTEGMKL